MQSESHLAEYSGLSFNYKKWFFSLNQMEPISSCISVMLNYCTWSSPQTSCPLKLDHTVPAIQQHEDAESLPTEKGRNLSRIQLLFLLCTLIRVCLMVARNSSPSFFAHFLCLSLYKATHILWMSKTTRNLLPSLSFACL